MGSNQSLGRLQERRRSVAVTGAALVARIVPDVSGIDKHFDYLVPPEMADRIVIGSMVRISLHGRRIGGWVIHLGGSDELLIASDRLVPIAKWSSIGPPEAIVQLAGWAAARWGSAHVAAVLRSASPATNIVRTPPGRRQVHTPQQPAELAVQRLSPNTDPLPFVIDFIRRGPTLILHPSVRACRAVAGRLRRQGYSVALMPDDWAAAAGGVDVVVGGRSAVWAPCPDLRAVVVLDEHDEGYQEQRSPTWHARDVAIERASRARASCLLISPAPSLAALHWAPIQRRLPLADERAGWPQVTCVDRSDVEPWKRSLLSSELIEALRSTRRVACIINRPGRSRLSACRACRAIQRCERCQAAVSQASDHRFVCERCATDRPLVCQVCGSGAMANVKPGVSRLREELEAAAARPVGEVVGDSTELAAVDVYVGTEALLHRVRNIDVVAFLDFDAELLAPRYRAGEQAMALLVRAARLVGPRQLGGTVMVQTTVPDHPVLTAAVLSDPGRFSDAESIVRRELGLPPYAALASVDGEGAAAFVESAGLQAAGSADSVLVRTPSWDDLGPALSATARPKGSRLKVRVDPPRR